ncbi:MAG: IS1380 family transposase [Bryobacterales bacterium]|nr:IS1380 family transposase [Bryobacterales bacterium]
MSKTLAPQAESSPLSTECTQSSFTFAKHFRRQVSARFDGGVISSDGGALLLREVDQRINLLPRLAACFEDGRNSQRIEHRVGELVSQRVYGLALGYEDLNDHDELRRDPVLAMLAGKSDVSGQSRRRERDRGQPLAGKSTLQRLERTTDGVDRYQKVRCDSAAIDRLLVEVFVEAHSQEPAEVLLDIDATDTPLHGQQEGRFFHGYYGHYCYLPLYIFSGEHVLCARQRVSNQDAAAGAEAELERIVAQLRDVWPKVKIILRADSGFCRDELLSWCEKNRVGYVVGLARNERLQSLIEEALEEASRRQQQTGRPARVYSEFEYRTLESWSRERRVVAKAEQLVGKQNPRYVVTSLDGERWPPQRLYEQLYCGRGEAENRIKEQLSLFADRMSTETLRANQLRLHLSSLAYVLLVGLRRLGLKGTQWARAQTETIRRGLLKIGALVKVSVRRVHLSLASGYPDEEAFAAVYRALRPPGSATL